MRDIMPVEMIQFGLLWSEHFKIVGVPPTSFHLICDLSFELLVNFCSLSGKIILILC